MKTNQFVSKFGHNNEEIEHGMACCFPALINQKFVSIFLIADSYLSALKYIRVMNIQWKRR